VLALHAPADRFDHLRLNVLGVDEPVRTDSRRETQREPAAGRPELRDHGAFRDAQRVQNLIRLLPFFAIRRFEQSQILRSEETAFRLRCLDRTGWSGGTRSLEGRKGREGRSEREKAHEQRDKCFPHLPHPTCQPHLTYLTYQPHLTYLAYLTYVTHPPYTSFLSSPTIPPRVIEFSERMSSSRVASTRPRSRTSSRIDLPVFTDSFAMSAVAA